MRPPKNLAFYLALSSCIPGISCKRPVTFAQQDNSKVLKIVREYRQSGQVASAVPIPIRSQMERPISLPGNVDDEELYEGQIRSYFEQGNFEQLEKAAHEARVGKGRFIGGVWKLFDFYFAVSRIPKGQPATEAAWAARLAMLKEWESAWPKSVTARVALAETYINYAWDGRGTEAASGVTEDQWQRLRERANLAESTLLEAARLKEKCPYWYEAMQHVAQAQGWDKSLARELMEQAVLFEPDFYHYYREYAYYLEPRWYGEPGEAEAFAKEISNRVGGQQGDFLYFEIASLLTCQCNPDPAHMTNLSWPRIQRGYAALDQLYGVSNLKRNRFAYMAYLAPDGPVAGEVLTQIGDNWDKEIWGSNERFESIRAWAVGFLTTPSHLGYSIDYVSATPKRGSELTVGDHIAFSVTAKYDLTAADTGIIVLVTQRDDNSLLTPGHRQVQIKVTRGAGVATLTDEFDVPAGTKMIRVCVPLVPAGYTRTSGELVLEYPVRQK